MKLGKENAVLYNMVTNIVTYTDYYAFGAPMRGVSGDYRYGFNGHEKIDEVSGSGNHYDLGLRHYSTRLGRMWKIDPRAAEYPWQSSYAYHRNSPIAIIDYLGGGGQGAYKSNANGYYGTALYKDGILQDAGGNAPGYDTPISHGEAKSFMIEGEKHYNTAAEYWADNEPAPSPVVNPSPVASNGNGKIELWSTTYAAVLGNGFGKLEAKSDITAVTGLWNHRAETGVSFGNGFALSVDFMNQTRGTINFESGVKGTDLAGLLNNASLINSSGGSVIASYNRVTAYKSVNDMTKVYSVNAFGGGTSLGSDFGIAGSRSVETFHNVPLTANQKLTRAVFDSTLSGGADFLNSKFGNNYQDSVKHYRKTYPNW